MNEKTERVQDVVHSFSLSDFKKSQQAMVAANDGVYHGRWSGRDPWSGQVKDFTLKEIQDIVQSGSVTRKRELSRYFFDKSGYYKELIMHYATLLKYSGILIPNTVPGKKMSNATLTKKYYAALDYVESMKLPIILSQIAQKVLVEGTYFGILSSKCSKSTFSLIDLPSSYCMCRLKDCFGNNLIEFDVSYFNTFSDLQSKKAALAAYPDFIVKAYNRWTNGKLKERQIIIPADIGVCFSFLDGKPFFLNVIPSIVQFQDSVDTEQKREAEEIRKIVVQKIPHLNDGRLLFEPDEAEEMHRGTVGMVKSDKDTVVLTTYGDVEVVSSKSTGEHTGAILDKMKENVYSQAGVSGEIFAASGGNTTETSLQYDTSIMMVLANSFSDFVTRVLNLFFGAANITFKYTILPITYHNEQKYTDSCFKLSQAGFSLLMPALAMGLNQKDLVSIKDLENDVLKLTDKLIPPATAFTQPGNGADNEGGRPKKEAGEKRDQTIKNEESKSVSKEQGGSK